MASNKCRNFALLFGLIIWCLCSIFYVSQNVINNNRYQLVNSDHQQIRLRAADANFVENSKQQIKILITGYGHSGSTHLQRFIGEVIFNHSDVFYLFEAMHTITLKYFATKWNWKPSKSSHNKYLDNDTTRSQILADFYQCNFKENVDYNQFAHSQMILDINSNLSNLTAAQLTNKCVSSKYIIFKEIDYHHFEGNYDYLLDRIADLYIFRIVRSPIDHILSLKRMWMPNKRELRQTDTLIAFTTDLICSKQLIDIKYAHNVWTQLQHHYYLLKMEEFFQNIAHNNTFHLANTFFNNIFHLQLENNDILSQQMKYRNITANKWEIGQSHPVQLRPLESVNYILQNCKEFMTFVGYKNI